MAELPSNPVAMNNVTVTNPSQPTNREGATPMTRATIATEIGDIEVELYDQSAPKAAKNFIDLAKQGLLRRRRSSIASSRAS